MRIVFFYPSLLSDLNNPSATGLRGLGMELLLRGHEVIVYEAATLAIGAPRIERLPLGRLPELTLRMQSTLILPPCQALQRNQHVRDRLEALDREASVA